MTDSATNSCSWPEVTDDSLPLDVELTFTVIGAPLASQNAMEMVKLTSHVDQNRPKIDTYAARVRHSLPEDAEVQEPANPPLRRRADYLPALNESISKCTM